MVFLPFAAAAIPGAFDCTSWSTPADAWAQASALDIDDSVYGPPARTGVDSVPHADVIDVLLAHVEPGCPYYNDGGDLIPVTGAMSITETCTTSSGDLIEWARVTAGRFTTNDSLGSWEVTITPASGDLTSITFSQETTGEEQSTREYPYYEFEVDTWSWEASWTGHLGDDYPDDGWMASVSSPSSSEDYTDGSWQYSLALDWSSPTCAWTLDFSQNYDGPLDTTWVLAQDAQTLRVVDGEGQTCGVEFVEAELDGTASTVTASGWTPLTDFDSDGYCYEVDDCEDVSRSVYPGARERPYDGVDQDCSGEDLVDVDGDGHDSVRVGGDDCNDLRRTTHPGAPDRFRDGVDQDCDGNDGT